MQRVVLVSYRRFGLTYQPLENKTYRLSWNVGNKLSLLAA